jgi:YesN/AraC family two-component response regulator
MNGLKICKCLKRWRSVVVEKIAYNLNELSHNMYETASSGSQVLEVADQTIQKENFIPLIFDAVEYIKMHYTESDLSLSQVAKYVNCSSQYLSQKFKEIMGMTYKEYLCDLRIEEAKKMLEEEHFSVNEVCQKVGWISASYFIRVFQNKTGVTPSNYRRVSRIENIQSSTYGHGENVE